jgi:hypothetical protein
MVFTETDPTPLAFVSGQKLMAAHLPSQQAQQYLIANQVHPLFTEVIHHWQAAGVDTTTLLGIDIRIGNLGDTALGLAGGNTIWPHDNAAGCGWFVGPTPRDESEFSTPDNQGEQHRMDLLTVLELKVGHLLGKEHEEGGIVEETLTGGGTQ